MNVTLDASPAGAANAKPRTGGRDALVDAVDVEVETYIGGATLSIGELKALDIGNVVTLDAALNAPVELKVNGCVIATGELVAVGDKFGVRIIALAP